MGHVLGNLMCPRVGDCTSQLSRQESRGNPPTITLAQLSPSAVGQLGELRPKVLGESSVMGKVVKKQPNLVLP